MNFIKKYWDIFGGIAAGLSLAYAFKFELKTIQLCYSTIILIIVFIGFFRLIKQEADKKKANERKHNIIDDVVDHQNSIKAISLAQAPTQVGEKVGRKILFLWGGTKTMMDKLKTVFSKFKGFMLTAALGVLTAVEMCGGFINSAFGGVLTINGVAVLPLVTLVCTIVVGIISNGYTKEQQEKIKALFSKATTNELVKEEIKKTIKEKSAQLAQYNKQLTTQQHELANLESDLERLNNTLRAKKEMRAMVPQLATDEDVRNAADAVDMCNVQMVVKREEIAKTTATVEDLTTTINALQSQLAEGFKKTA